MLNLQSVTLVAVATTEIDATCKAIAHSCAEISYGSVKLLSSCDSTHRPKICQWIEIPPFKSVGEWGRFVVFDLHRYIDSEFILLIHADGFVVNPDKWRNEFLEFDYVGAPWPLPRDYFSYRDYYGNIIRVGNSVSLRSARILRLPSQLNLPWSSDHGYFHEDGYLCVQNRHILQEYNVRFAPLSVSVHFSRERTLYENKHIEPFAFHKWHGKNRKYPRFSKGFSPLNKIKNLFTGHS